MKYLNLLFFCILCQFFLLFPLRSYGEATPPTGVIRGEVADAVTRAPLIGANIMLMDTESGAATDETGKFVLPQVPVGSYRLKCTYIGYAPIITTDIIVKSARTTTVEIELTPSPLRSEALTITAGYFSRIEDEPVGTANFSNEEIRRAPGSGGDVSRILFSLPSVAKVNDQSNQLIVRGGNPMENTFFIDHIEVPNINHFPTAASSGGPIGMVNVDFIRDVTFYTGGFPVQYGDKLSSVMDIAFREGNREEFAGQLDLNFAGFGGVVESPLWDGRGSLLLSVRRSYLDLVVKTLDVGSTVAPRYGDLQGKVVLDVSPNQKLSLISLIGDDHNSPDRETGLENKMLYYGNQDILQGTTGLNWRALWAKNGYSNTSLAYTSERFSEDFYETSTAAPWIRNHSREQTLKFRNENHIRFMDRLLMEFGAEAKYLISEYDNFYGTPTNALGHPVPALSVDNQITTQKAGGYLDFMIQPTLRSSLGLGVRGDYFSYTDRIILSPRAAFTYRLTDRTKLDLSTGIFYQNLPLLLLAQHPENRDLKDLRAVHYIVGIEHLLTPNTRLTLDLYRKDYRHFPLDPEQPGVFILDDDQLANYGILTDGGQARSQGIEMMLQKKLATDFYGLASVSVFRSQYKGLSGVWKDRKYDNRVMFSIEGGYKPNRNWECSLRWLYAGGPPYTPLDIPASMENHRDVLDENRINEARYPDYHSMNVRVDRRFNFRDTNLIFYLSIWNAYDHKNVATYFWNDQEQKQDVIYQWRILPIFGLEYEF